ncbi:MAG: SMI1/KNR4 family protein [Flavobacteriaceae bacterium]|nr:SMI1/KNR4 family protein [Flavobacteriaceae bacterium]
MIKFIILTLKALIFAIIGSIAYLWDNITYKQGSPIVDSDKKIEEVWQEYREYWVDHEPMMTAPDTCNPNTEEEIEKLENLLDIKLPNDFRQSLKSVKHSNKKCDDNLSHSWFGSRTGILLYDVEDIISDSLMLRKYHEFYIDDYNIYWNDITPFDSNRKYWLNEWIPILTQNNIIIFIDLREGIGDEYGQVLAYLATDEGGRGSVKAPEYLLKNLNNYTPNPNNRFNNFVFIAKDYKEFMQLMMEEIKANNKLKDRYFTKLFDLPYFYFW